MRIEIELNAFVEQDAEAIEAYNELTQMEVQESVNEMADSVREDFEAEEATVTHLSVKVVEEGGNVLCQSL